MKIVAISDTHGEFPELPECDLLLIGGDVCPTYDHSIVFQRSWLETNFSAWLMGQKARLIIGIGGNHDFALEQDRDFAARLPWRYLLDEAVEFDGVKMHGIPWVPNLGGWAFHHMDHVLDEKFALIENDVDIVLSHGPPWKHGDRTVARFGDCNAGFPGTLDMLQRVRPKLFICGHIHEAYGYTVHETSSTLVANVSHMTENYEPINTPATFWLERGHLWAPCDGYPLTPRAAQDQHDLSQFAGCTI